MAKYTYIPDLHFQISIFKGPNIWTDFDTLIVEDFINSLIVDINREKNNLKFK